VVLPRCFRRVLALGAAALSLVAPALAHPHILIDAKIDVIFDDAGAVTGLQHAWRFDIATSAWMSQGLDTNGDRITSPEELQGLADENMIGLADYGFYTVAGDSAAPMHFTPLGNQGMRYDDGYVTLSFGLKADRPQPISGRFEIGVYDPEYYVAINFAGEQDIQLINAPASCVPVFEPPRPMSPEVEERLYTLGPEVLELPPDLAAAMRGTQGLIVVDCSGVAPVAQTAVEAVNAVAEKPRGAPFGGPPPEPGLNLPRTGFFGWLQDQQRGFYAELTRTLDLLRTDWNAFWVLGGLSFLYGVFHAAGPGHGKVVISSYMLANESQLRRGVSLSVISALLQSLVAIVFVLVAAGLLGLTSLALNDVANWIGIASYSLIVLLGLWLVGRKLFGWGHQHHHYAPDMAKTAHAHLHDHGHHNHDHHEHDHHHDDHHEHGPQCNHSVDPKAAGGSWREQLGVVLAVGLRPCSGALVVMVFALSQGLLPAGILSVLLMGVGTAITVASLAIVAVSAKDLARRIGGIDNPMTAHVLWWLELAGAACVLAFGVLFLIANL
jgi:nickel/cobalt exporter